MKNIRCSAFFVCLVVSTFLACQPKGNQEAQESAAASTVPAYPALSNEQHSHLYQTADQVDIIFYNLPISVNQDDVASVRNTVLYISPESPDLAQKCNPLGRLTWMANGSILREADIYIGPGCQYLLFIENGQPVAANVLAPSGAEFFENIVRQVEQRRQ